MRKLTFQEKALCHALCKNRTQIVKTSILQTLYITANSSSDLLRRYLLSRDTFWNLRDICLEDESHQFLRGVFIVKREREITL